MAAHLSTLLQNLTTGSDLLSTLEGIKTLLETTHPTELKEVLKNVSFDPVFSCLNSTNREELELSRNILTKLLDNVDGDVVLAQFRDELCMGLGHPREEIRALCLKQIRRAVEEKSDGLITVISDLDFLSLIISKVGDDSLSVAKVAMAVLEALGSEIKGQEVLMGGQALDDLKRVARKNDTVRYRVFEVVTCIAISSPEGLQHASSTGVLQDLISDLNTKDILIQLNATEMLTSLVVSQHALQFLDQQGVMGRLENLLIGAEADPSQGFLIPAIIKFFGSVARFDPKGVTEQYGSFLRITFDLLPSHDITLVGVAVETIGFVGRTAEGKQALDKQGQAMLDALKQIGRLLIQPPTERRVRALVATADLFTLPVENQTDDLLSLLEKWFTHLVAKPLELILSLCKQPFKDIRCHALSIMQALANQAWAERLMNQEAGCLEYLLDRTTEPEKEGKEVKFAVVKALAESPSVEVVFGRPGLLRLRGYVREGPFYVRVQSEVAMESS